MPKVGYYAVAKGRKPGIYMDWKDCEAQVLNFNGAKYKKFLNAGDAELWINENAQPPPVSPSAAASRSRTTSSVAAQPVVFPPASPIPTRSVAARLVLQQTTTIANAAVTTSRDDVPVQPVKAAGSSLDLQAPRTTPSPPPLQTASSSCSKERPGSSSDSMVVYTDGSCRGNGKAGSTAGVGVFWGENDLRNVCERCPGDQTNNRAELIAIIRVLERAPTDRPLEIRSDSDYSIKSMTRWLKDWKDRGWRKADGKVPSNLTLIRYADALLEERRELSKQPVIFKKVLAHSGEVGNEAADHLANLGATLPPVSDEDWDDLLGKVHARLQAASAPTPAQSFTSTSRGTENANLTRSVPIVPQAQSMVRTSKHAAKSSSAPIRRLAGAVAPASLPSPQRVPPIENAIPEMEALHGAQTSVERRYSGAVYGHQGVSISAQEMEAYASCLLDDDELMREALQEGIYS